MSKRSTKPTTKGWEDMTMSEAEQILRKFGEWHGVVGMGRETILKWAAYLKSDYLKSKEKS